MSSSKTINAVSAADAVTEAIAHYSRSQIAISRREIEAYILEERLGLFKQSEIDAAISQKLGDEIVLADGRLITNAAIDREKETIALAAKDRDRIAPLAWDAVQYCQKLLDEGITLTKGQENALLSSVTSTDRVVIWQGIAGSGKSFALKHLTEIAAEQGIAITGIAPTNSAAQNLATAVGIECLTVANFLNPKNIDRSRSSNKQFFERGEDGVRRLEVDRGLIVDESGLIGAEDMRSILSVAAAQNYKVFLVGDRYQHKPVSAGCPFASLQDAGINPIITMNQSQLNDPTTLDTVETIREIPLQSQKTIEAQLNRIEEKIEKIEQIQLRQDQELLLMSETFKQVGNTLKTLGDRQNSLNQTLSNLAQRQKTLNEGLSLIAAADINLNEILKDLGTKLDTVARNIKEGNDIGQLSDKRLDLTLRDLATTLKEIATQ
ncbi:MAG: AAA family ATPase [Prochloraceae cyanobacterium]